MRAARVNGEIHASGREGLFDFLGEHSLGAYFGEGDIGDLVAGCMNDFNLDFVAVGA